MTKNSPAKATNAHVSIIGHITRDELRRYLDRTEAGNGFANRFLWICAKRSKVLPEGGQIHKVDFGPHLQALRVAVKPGRTMGELKRDPEARELWCDVYEVLSEGRPGLVGAVIARGEAQVMRLAVLYALLDASDSILAPHLRAALEVWRYSEESARHIFGDAIGDPKADEALSLLRDRPEGMTRSELSLGLFGKHGTASSIDRVLRLLWENGLIRQEMERTDGRSAERWYANQEGVKGVEGVKGSAGGGASTPLTPFTPSAQPAEAGATAGYEEGQL